MTQMGMDPMTCIHSDLIIKLANLVGQLVHRICWSRFLQGRSFLNLDFKVKFKLNLELVEF